MLTLSINTATSETSIALLKEGLLLSEKSWLSHNDEAEKLMPEIDSMFVSEGAGFSDLKKVVVISGPGSFTGLRVGITVANTISYLTGCELYGVETLPYLWTAVEQTPQTALLVFAGRGGVYFSKSPQDEPKIVNLEDLNVRLKSEGITQVYGDITEDQKAILEGVEFKEVDISFGKISEKLLAQDLTPVKIIKPNYIKKPSITKSTKTLFN